MLSYLISDPERLIHLRWTDAIPNENGNSRPDSVISEKKQLAFGSSLGFGEANIQQGSCSKLLCLDTLRLAIFTKNAIDVHKLDGALAFQMYMVNCLKRERRTNNLTRHNTSRIQCDILS